MPQQSNRQPDRRQFIGAASAASLTTACLAAPAYGVLPWPAGEAEKPWFEISLAQWSLNRTLFAGKMTNLDFPTVAKEKLGISAVEYVNAFFKDKAEDAKYLAQLNQRCDDAGVKSLLIMVDGEGNLGAPDATARTKTVENHRRWVTAAKTLGCHSIRVNAASKGSYDEQVKLAADGLRQLSEFAGPVGINVIVENHGGLSSNGQWLAQVIRRVNLDNCGTLPDFGNFQISDDLYYDQQAGIAAMLPFAKSVSAKSYSFDEAGNEANMDYLKLMTMVKDSGYQGYVGVEFEGSGTPKLSKDGKANAKMPELEGIAKTRDLLIKCREQLA